MVYYFVKALTSESQVYSSSEGLSNAEIVSFRHPFMYLH